MSSPRLWYVVFFILFICVASGLAPILVNIRQGVASSSSGLRSFTSLLSSANQSIVDSALPPTQSSLSTSLELMGLLREAPEAQAVLDDVGLLLQQLEAVSEALESTAAAATAFLAHEWRVSKHVVFSNRSLGNSLWQGCLATIVALGVFVSLTLIGLRTTKCSARAFRWYNGLLPFTLLLLCLFCAALFIVALAGADVCAAPGAAVLAMLNATHAGGPAGAGQLGPAYQAARFYTTTCGTEPPAGAFFVLLEAKATVEEAVVDLQTLNATLSLAGNATLRTAAASLISLIAANVLVIGESVNSTLLAVDCPPVYEAFLGVSAADSSSSDKSPRVTRCQCSGAGRSWFM